MTEPVAPIVASCRARFAVVLDRLALPPDVVLVAVSGGADSLALLDLLAQEAPARGFRLRVIHFDHGIDPASGTVASVVRQIAVDRYRLPCDTERAALGTLATETEARAVRQDWFDRLLADHRPALLMTAHQADDQLETMLMRFLEGSGPAGLVGIRERRGDRVRPLLTFARAELADYADALGLPVWSDPANRDPRHLRAWVRTRLLPAIERRLPRLRPNLAAARDVFEEARTGWDGLVTELPDLDFRLERDGASVAAPPLVGYSSAVVRSLLRAIGRRVEIQVGSRQLDRLQALLAHGDTGQRVDLGGGAQGELVFGRIRLFRPAEHPTNTVVIESESGQERFGGWLVSWRPEVAPAQLEREGFQTWLDWPGIATIRPWRPGDRVRPIRGRGGRLVVRCMQEKKVPSSQRPDWPVLESEGAVIWVPGVCRGDGRVPVPGSRAVRLDVSAS